MEEIRNYIISKTNYFIVDSPRRDNPSPRNSIRRARIIIPERSNIIYAIICDYANIWTVHSDGRMIKLTNLIDGQDQNVREPLIILDNMIRNESLKKISLKIFNNCKVHMMYCHMNCVSLDSKCRNLLICGSVGISLVRSYWQIMKESEEYQQSHASRCIRICEECQPLPTFDLIDGEHLILENGNFHVKVNSYKHVIYLTLLQVNGKFMKFKSNNRVRMTLFNKFIDEQKKVL